MAKGTLTLSNDHDYAVDQRPIPGVTDVLTDVRLAPYSAKKEWVASELAEILSDESLPKEYRGTSEFRERLERARIRGNYVHQATAWHDQGDLDESGLDPEIKPRLDAWKKFLFDTGFKATYIEAKSFDPVYWFAGTIDRGGRIGRKTVVIDIKPPNEQKFWAYQLAAYCMIWYPGTIPIRLNVMLHGDGRYTTKEHLIQDFPRHQQVFLSALDVYNEKRAA